MKKKIFKFALKFLVSLLFLFYVIFKVQWKSVLSDVREIEVGMVFLYVIVVIFGMLISSYKWKVLANFKNIHQKLYVFFKFYLTGTFINNFMPSFIGGDTYKAYQIGKPEKRYIEAGSTVMMDRITGLFGATILALFFTLLNIKTVVHSRVLIIINIIVLISFILDILLAKVRNYSFWSRFAKYFPKKLVEFLSDLKTYNNNSQIIFKAIGIAFLFNVIGVALANYILFLSLGIHIGLLNYLSVIFLISVISSVPISINNVGIKEWAYITLFGVFGLAPAQVVTVAIISRFIQMFISFFALPAYLKRNKK